jgi:hypothetical protein
MPEALTIAQFAFVDVALFLRTRADNGSLGLYGENYAHRP